MIWDLITIGGGAAGFFGAITHADAGGGSTLILEKTPNLLAKVKISGGGRCNVTHHCFDPKALSKNYPRGEKALIGPLHRWSAGDTVRWFTTRGVQLKTEPDGRMFPVSDSSQTIIDCLLTSAQNAGVEIRTKTSVTEIHRQTEHFILHTETGETLLAKNILLATGGTRLAAGARLAQQLGHTLIPPVPSLFTFKIDDTRLRDIPGISVAKVDVHIPGTRLKSTGPLLITHWGVSGPGILRLSAWGARELADKNYTFSLNINWLPDTDVPAQIQQLRQSWGKRQLHTRSPFEQIPKRLWNTLLTAAQIPPEQTWSHLTKTEQQALINQLTNAQFPVDGKSTNKEEFVTCGGVQLRDIDMKTMQSKICPGLYFAGEIMDIDGITGGFNFQNAWTSAHHAGTASAQTLTTVKKC